MRDPVERAGTDAGAALHLIRSGVRLIAAGEYDRRAVGIGEAAGHPQPKPDAHIAAAGRLERAVPAAGVDVDRPHLDPMLTRIADDLGGCVEPHRLGIEEGGAEYVRVVALHPAAGIGDQREAGGVALRESVGAEPLDLLERLLGKLRLVAAHHHAVDQLVPKMADATGQLERRHRPAQQVGLASCEPGALDRNPHRLLLEQRHAERLLEHAAQFLGRISDRLLALAPAQIRMNHVALDRSWTYDRNLDDQIVEGGWLDPRQHRHLRAAFDLEYA